MSGQVQDVLNRFEEAMENIYGMEKTFETKLDNDVEHPMDITMSRVCLASDMCDIYFTYTKVTHLLYTCSLDPFEDGILLDTSPGCMHRYCRNATDDVEECKRQGTPTPSAREVWKRRRKKKSYRRSSSHRTTGRVRTSGA